jgi:hypothetical protein
MHKWGHCENRETVAVLKNFCLQTVLKTCKCFFFLILTIIATKLTEIAIFNVSTVLVLIQFFWNVVLCYVEVFPCFKGRECFIFGGRGVQGDLKMKALCTFETLGNSVTVSHRGRHPSFWEYFTSLVLSTAIYYCKSDFYFPEQMSAEIFWPVLNLYIHTSNFSVWSTSWIN